MPMTFEQFFAALKEATEDTPTGGKKNNAQQFNNYLNEFLQEIFKEDPFTQEEIECGKDAVRRWMRAHGVEEVNEMPSDNQQTQIVPFPKQEQKNLVDLEAAASEDDKIQSVRQHIPEEQTPDDKPRFLGKLKAKGCELSFMAYNQEIYVSVKNATNKKLSKLVFETKRTGKNFRAFAGSLPRILPDREITEPEITGFIAGHKQSPNTHDITWS